VFLHIQLYFSVSSYYYICVLILLHVCPHIALYVSSKCCISVLRYIQARDPATSKSGLLQEHWKSKMEGDSMDDWVRMPGGQTVGQFPVGFWSFVSSCCVCMYAVVHWSLHKQFVSVRVREISHAHTHSVTPERGPLSTFSPRATGRRGF